MIRRAAFDVLAAVVTGVFVLAACAVLFSPAVFPLLFMLAMGAP